MAIQGGDRIPVPDHPGWYTLANDPTGNQYDENGNTVGGPAVHPGETYNGDMQNAVTGLQNAHLPQTQGAASTLGTTWYHPVQPATTTGLHTQTGGQMGDQPQGPVLQNGTPIQGDELNLTKRGYGEQQWQDQGGFYNKPGNLDAFTKALNDRFGPGGANLPGVSNYAKDAYQSALNGPTSAGLDPYYQNAKRMAGEDIDKRLSSRGLYGSSAADNAISEAMTNLSAEQANREADFGLKRAGLLGSLASGADTSGLNASGDQRAWLKGLADLNQATDTGDINRTNSGMNAANAAQTQNLNRTGQIWNQEMGFGNAMSDIMGKWYGNSINGDQQNFDNAQTAATGVATEGANQASQNAVHEQTGNQQALATGVSAVKPALAIGDALNKPAAVNPVPTVPQASPATVASYQYPQPDTYPGTSGEKWNQY